MEGHLVDLTIDGDGELGPDSAVLDDAVVRARTFGVEGAKGGAERRGFELEAAAAIAQGLEEGGDDNGDHWAPGNLSEPIPAISIRIG
jgi:hypothetical protein